jgi:hypothetical protein
VEGLVKSLVRFQEKSSNRFTEVANDGCPPGLHRRCRTPSIERDAAPALALLLLRRETTSMRARKTRHSRSFRSRGERQPSCRPCRSEFGELAMRIWGDCTLMRVPDFLGHVQCEETQRKAATLLNPRDLFPQDPRRCTVLSHTVTATTTNPAICTSPSAPQSSKFQETIHDIFLAHSLALTGQAHATPHVLPVSPQIAVG